MRRRLIQLGLFIFAGAIVNVAVAWGCVVWSPKAAIYHETVDDAAVNHAVWSRSVPADWLHLFQRSSRPSRLRGFGYRLIGAFGGASPEHLTHNVTEVSSGWPLYSMRGAGRASQAGGIDSVNSVLATFRAEDPKMYPLAPIWPGFAINTLFYAGVLWLLIAAPFALRRRRRVKRGLCPACAYPVGDSEVCTECGRPHTVKPKEMAA